VFSIRESLNGQAVRGERCGADRGDTRQGGENLAVGLGKQPHDLRVDSTDI
jgi:hypothetical protein